jgi:hypothetical protein
MSRIAREQGGGKDLDNLKAISLGLFFDLAQLGIQAVSFGLLLGGYSPVTDGPKWGR